MQAQARPIVSCIWELSRPGMHIKVCLYCLFCLHLRHRHMQAPARADVSCLWELSRPAMHIKTCLYCLFCLHLTYRQMQAPAQSSCGRRLELMNWNLIFLFCILIVLTVIIAICLQNPSQRLLLTRPAISLTIWGSDFWLQNEDWFVSESSQIRGLIPTSKTCEKSLISGTKMMGF